jgi:hypothetical protein
MSTNLIATPWNPKKLAAYDVRRFIPPHIIEVINTPHEHENADHNKPVGIIWLHKIGFPPVIDTLCDTPDSAVYHYGALVEYFQNTANKANLSAYVERVPMNHRFASSLNDVFADKTFTSMRERTARNAYRYPRDGD